MKHIENIEVVLKGDFICGLNLFQVRRYVDSVPAENRQKTQKNISLFIPYLGGILP